MLRQLIKPALGIARDTYALYAFRRSDQMNRYQGFYPTYAAAKAALPPGKPEGFDSDDVADYFLASHPEMDASDYPVLFRLVQILAPGYTVFDMGGGLGQCYYAYRKYIHFPSGLRWLICDVHAFIRRGREIARERNAEALEFTQDWQDADGASIYLTNGTLQYLEPDLADILGGLCNKPQHVLVNRIPTYEGELYYTVQRGRHLRQHSPRYFPYKVMNTGQFIHGMEKIGYKKIDQWNLPRDLHVPFHPQRYVSNYKGFYFNLREPYV
jgi:putative methyltransferase (TIGR04325 family)